MLGASSLCQSLSLDASVPLAEIYGGLLATSPLLGATGKVAGFPTAALPGAPGLSPGDMAQCPLLVPSVDRGPSVSVGGRRSLGRGAADQVSDLSSLSSECFIPPSE